MTTAELLQGGVDEYISARRELDDAEMKRALTYAALRAEAAGRRDSYRQARLKLVALRAEEDHTYTLTDRDAREFAALVNLPDRPIEIDWDSVYDDPDL